MEYKLLVILYLTTLPLNIISIAIDKVDSSTSTNNDTQQNKETFENKPNPSPLIVPGYNLPGPIFNNGQPFYVEKDPVTGQIDFNSKTSAGKQSSYEYDYSDEEPNTNIFDKSNIDRKDGGYGSHRPNDINQLTPNFHDFLNLPVKYNPDKYVYPLISSSYANTKIQGNVNSYNHKNYGTTTFKPTVSPTYYTTKQSVYYNKPKDTYTTEKPKSTTSTTQKTTTTQPSTKSNLLNSPMNHPSYTTEENYEDYDYFTTKAPTKTEQPKTDKPTTTHRPYSIFDELFGDYEEPKPLNTPSLFGNLANKFGDKINKDEPSTTSSPKQNETNSHGLPITNNYNKDEYEYEDYFSAEETENVKKTTPQTVTPSVIKTSTSIVTESSIAKKPITEKVQTVYSNFHQNYNVPENKPNDTKTTEKPEYISITNYDDYDENEEKITKPSTKPISITETPQSMRVTSMPLGENHPIKMPSIITMTHHNIKEQLNSEKVDITTETPEKIMKKEETVSYVVGQHHIEMPQKETFVSNSFRPLYTPQNNVRQPEFDEKGEIKEKLTFTGTGQTNSNYSWTVPTKNNYDTYAQFDMPNKNIYNQDIQSNYSWRVPETTTHKKYIPEQSNIKYSPPQTNALYKPAVQTDFNLQQVSSGYSIGQPVQSYGQGQVFNVGVSTSFNGGSNKYQVPQSNYQYMQVGTNYNMSVHPEGGASINIQPLRGTEASLSIGSPTGEIKTVPGQVINEKLDLKDEELRKKPSNKIVFPDDKHTTPKPNKEILSLYSKPMLHPLPADLTPPTEKEVRPQPRPTNVRPPWDPRPGHFYQGRPEYARPPRPPMKPDIYKRIDGLPNILPQFRPNAKGSHNHYHDIPINQNYMQRQPLLERPSNRPIGFFEKLHPPPPPKRILELRKPVTLSQHLMHHEPKLNEPSTQNPPNYKQDQYTFQNPPKVPVNRRNGEDETEIATLQMIHAKQTDKLNTIKPNVPPPFKINYKDTNFKESTTEKPLYVVYPVNSSPLKLDVLDNEKETVVIGTRAGENPLPPSKINDDVPTYTAQKPILKPKEPPILKPQSKPTNYPIKTDFPYPLERPDATYNDKGIDYPKKYQPNNQWGIDTESRIVSGNKINYAEPISVTLKMNTGSPIAIAYTPTESSIASHFSMPNLGSAVISEIRNDKLRNAEIINGKNKGHQGIVSNSGNEFTVSAVMHTHQQNNMMLGTTVRKQIENHKIEPQVEQEYPTKLDFQAPFHASVNIGSSNNGWSVIRDKSKDIDRSDNDVTTISSETSSEFDIENFKPQMFGGFKPIYDLPDEKDKVDTDLSERE